MNEQFSKDVDLGLSAQPKSLPSKYFYDKKGDMLFQQIMHMPEYYLTKSELEIFEKQSTQIIQTLDLQTNIPFELIELGAGDGLKTKALLKSLLKNGYQFQYVPIDISADVLITLEQSLKNELPNLDVNTKHGDYFQILTSLKENKLPKVVLFLGSNLGNYSDERAATFVEQLSRNLSLNDKVLVGVDLIKSKEIVLPAYNDKAGITKNFNLNLLTRINSELNADFDISNFEHAPEYTEQEGIARSSLVSKIDQAVCIKSTGKTYSFKKGETIKTEISRKYNDQIIARIVAKSDLVQTGKLTDGRGYFADYIFNCIR